MTAEQRRLAAILVADVVGYSRLMGQDESGMLAALKSLRQEIVDPAMASHGGRTVKTTGDGMVVEFASVVDALRCCPYRKRHPGCHEERDRLGLATMIGFLILLFHVLISPFKTQARLEAEIVLLRHQLGVLRQRVPSRPKLTVADRLLFVWLYRLFPSVLNTVTIIQPETVIRWHRMGFRLYWRWKSRSRGGRPKVPLEIRRLIREMSLANRLWGAPRIHGELLKLGIEVA